jgi:hypothetical protein
MPHYRIPHASACSSFVYPVVIAKRFWPCNLFQVFLPPGGLQLLSKRNASYEQKHGNTAQKAREEAHIIDPLSLN